MSKIAGIFGVRGVLGIVVMMLVASGALRLGAFGFAVAKEASSDEKAVTTPVRAPVGVPQNFEEMLSLIEKRTMELDRKEIALLDREQALKVARQNIDQELERLIETEDRLRATIARVDGAAEDDVTRLTSVYETMKPKMAAAVFEQMAPEFAAGFLGRMNSGAAANIMSALTSEKAYAISVVLAGRNANAPTQ